MTLADVTLNRRSLFYGGSALALVGCTSGGSTPADTARADLDLLDAGLVSALAILRALPAGQRPSDAILAQIQAQIDNYHKNLDLLKAATVPAEVVQQVGAILTAIAGLATPFFPAAPFVAMAINAALTLWPTIAALLAAVPAPAALPRVRMSTAQARATLKAISTP